MTWLHKGESVLQIPEVLSPAGDRERLEAAVRYGADAVYLGGSQFGMRAASASFGGEQLKLAVDYAHAHHVRVYLTCNTLPTNEQAAQLPEFLLAARDAGVDALIVADVGILMLARRLVPEIPVHISTQAGVVNYLTATELHQLGAARVVLARELSLEAIRYIREHTPPALEIEVFVHGAMCMSFSGRCLLSNYLTQRDANRGECSQPCRWKYHLVEQTRPGQYFPVQEDPSGSYILNAKDLCMIEHLDKLVEAGVTSLKIEGRAKSAYYTAAVTNAYRGAVDAYLHNPQHFQPPAWTLEEVTKVSHRAYSTGFFFGRPDQYYQNAGYVRAWDIIAVVEGWEDGKLLVSERNRFSVGDTAEVMLPRAQPVPLEITGIFDLEEETEVEAACHPMRRYLLPYDQPLPAGAMIRRPNQ
ncbi:MAG: U32 family peptidase [Anaerotruncus sp.]|nr:U32 family peptidase [Anaerotruncus sp.]